MRQFVASSPLSSDGTLRVTDKDFRYLKQVLRIQNGDMLAVRLPDGSLCNMTAAQVDASCRTVTLQLCAKGETSGARFISEHGAKSEKNGVSFYLFQFIAKPQKMDLIIRQATECGVELIVPVIGEYCEKGAVSACRASSSKAERWQRIIREALSQCGSATNTRVAEPMSVQDAASFWKSEGGGIALSLYERNEKTVSLHKALSAYSGERICLAVGAEGGISPSEIETLSQAGFSTIHFSTNILRCETAALYGIASVQSALSEKDLWQFKE